MSKKRAERFARQRSVHTTDGKWVGFFYDEEAAAAWIRSRLNPSMFTIDEARKEGAEPLQGIFVSKSVYAKGTAKMKATCDENGFIKNTRGAEPLNITVGKIEHTGKVPERSAKRQQSTTPKPRRKKASKPARKVSDVDLLAAAVDESLEADGTDDNTRKGEELAI